MGYEIHPARVFHSFWLRLRLTVTGSPWIRSRSSHPKVKFQTGLKQTPLCRRDRRVRTYRSRAARSIRAWAIISSVVSLLLLPQIFFQSA
ncbi:hypothetical protein B0H12DRAFT_665963 [Mycena haematopus]|nr:hypothetical protein B0H12DRAFT_665963 [Mycena haematopus]